MSDNILYVPIQINGGDSKPQSLLDRELYVCPLDSTADTKQYMLKCGQDNGVVDIWAKSNEVSVVQSAVIAFEASPNSTGVTIQNMHIYNIGSKLYFDAGMVISETGLLDKVILTEEMYGTEFPTGDIKTGQLFYRIPTSGSGSDSATT